MEDENVKGKGDVKCPKCKKWFKFTIYTNSEKIFCPFCNKVAINIEQD
ncbi:MAG: hypothetical protein ABH811_01215 [archaeon]